MNTITTLIEMIDRNPDDLFTPGVLRDALQDVEERTFAEAERITEQVVQAARDARDLAAAAAIMSGSAEWLDAMRKLILCRAGLYADNPATILLVPGNSPPIATEHYRSNPGAWWYEWTVTVGALVVTAMARNYEALSAPSKPRRPSRRARK